MKKTISLFLAVVGLLAGQTPAAYPGSYLVVNDASTGTTFQKLAKISGGKAILSATSDDAAIGVCVQNCGTTGSSVIAFSGVTGIVVDATTTLDHWLVESTTVAGDAHDTGFTTCPSIGKIVGVVVQASSGAASVSQVKLTNGDCSVPAIRQNSKSANYTTVLDDAGKMIYHPSADTTARVWTIDSNANVPYPISTCITFFNDTSAGTITIAITSDTLVLAGAGSTGSRTLAANGLATACKMTGTRWMINGAGLT